MTDQTASPAPTGEVGARPTDESDTPPADSTPTDQSVNALADTLIGEAPEPQPHAIAQRAQAEAESQAQTAEAVKQFPGFDPAVHAMNPDGTPAKTPTGRFAKIRKGRVSTPRQPINVPNGAASPGPAQSAAATKEALARQGGAGCANLIIALSVGIGGEDFLPRRDVKIGLDEKAMLEGAFGDYFVATGKTDLPPGWALVAAMSMYVLPRLGMPKTQSRLQRVKDWMKVKYMNYRLRRAGIKARVRNPAEAERASDALAGKGIVKGDDDDKQPG